MNTSFEALTPEDEQVLRSQNDVHWFGASVLFSLINTLSCGKKFNKPSLAQQHGFFLPFFISFAVSSIVIYLVEYYRNSKFRKDIVSKQKVLREVQVLKKERYFSPIKFTIQIDVNEPEFRYLTISETDYQKVQKGDIVTLVYAKYSKHFFEVRF